MTQNNTIKVTPTSRGNFSKLRKYKEGGVPKYLEATTEGGVLRRYTNTGYTAGNNSGWSESIFTPEFQEKLFSEIKNPNTTPERRKQLVQAINATQQAYEDLRKTRSVSNPALFELAVLDYLKRIIELYPALNQIGIANGVNTGRYTYAKNRITGDNAGDDGSWSNSADGVYGAQTNDRTILGYDGDWNELGDRFKLMNLDLKGFGYLVSKGLTGKDGYTNAYYINEIPTGEVITGGTTGGGTTTGGTTGGSSTSEGGTSTQYEPWKPVDYDKVMNLKFKPLKDWNTAPLWNAAQYGNTVRANNREYETMSDFRTPLDLAPQVHGLWNGDYTYQTAIGDQMAKNNLLGALLMGSTSDLTQGMQAALAANNLNNQLAVNAAQHLDLKYQQESDKAVAREDTLSQYNTQVANTNNSRLKAAWNKRLELRAMRDLKNAQAREENLVANRVDQESFNKMNWLNLRDLYNSMISDWGARKNMDLLNKYSSSQDLTKDEAFSNMYNNMFDSEGNLKNKTNPGDYNDDVAVGYMDWLSTNGKANNIQNFAAYAQNSSYWGDEDVTERIGAGLNSVVNLWKTNAENARNNLRLDQLNLNLYLKMMLERAPMQYSGLHTFEGFTAMNPYLFATPSDRAAKLTGTQYNVGNEHFGSWYLKEGGSIDKNADRFLKYLQHNQKGEDHNRDRVHKYTKDSLSMLMRDLGALDRETLLLLREIFK